MNAGPHTVRTIGVFVSSPGDVDQERKVLESAVKSINSADGAARGLRLELFKWEDDVVSQIGPLPQPVIDRQTPEYEIYLGIMSTRFGSGGTEAEFRAALTKWKSAKTPWITFYFDARPAMTGDPDQAEQFAKVCKFRKELESLGIVATYAGVRGSDDSFYDKVSDQLRKLLYILVPVARDSFPSATTADPTRFLRNLFEQTAYIDVRGLSTGKGQAHRFGIEALYISLTSAGSATIDDAPQGDARQAGKGKTGRPKRSNETGDDEGLPIQGHREVPLAASLRGDRLVIVGHPGAGKTTFLRRIACALCQTELGDDPRAAEERLGIADRTFPILVRISALAQHLKSCERVPGAPKGDTAAAWLPHFLAACSNEQSCGLDETAFRQRLEGGQCTVLLDGLDEAPDRLLRERLSRLIENLTRAYPGCRYVVTSRPAAYAGQAVLPGFTQAHIDPLSDSAVETFLSRWCEAIYAASETAAHAHCAELLAAIRARPEIKRMARNPVMLTALAVVHWNERHLPEQRADLYHSIILWLSRSREQRPERQTADRTIVLLQELALAMQNDPDERKTLAPKRWAAEQLAPEFGAGQANRNSIDLAERFLDQEELDSGIIVGRGNQVAFWHLTFQEYLAAKAIASRLEQEQRRIIFDPADKVYSSDWREVLLLLAGALHEQGKAKVDGLIGAVLDGLRQPASPADRAQCAGVIGAILRDLTPLDYQVADRRYHDLLEGVMAIFDPVRSASVPIPDRIAAADALGQAGDSRLDASRADYWVTIPSGKFLMGAQSKDPQGPNYDKEAYDDESPPHEVDLDAFRIARFPVTVGQYAQFVRDGGYEDKRWWDGVGFERYDEPEQWETQVEFLSRAVVGVSWWEAAAYCAWANLRLPTEAEWERAARGTQGRKYPWGSEPPNDSRANYNRNIGHPTPVGIYPLDRTPEGICDMGGNVWEWCSDELRGYSVDRVRNPDGLAQATARVLRGGSWAGDARGCRAAYRSGDGPRGRFGNLGFRVAAVPFGGAGQKEKLAEPGAEARSERGGAA